MKRRSKRIGEMLEELMPLAHAVGGAPNASPETSLLLASLYDLLRDHDSEALHALFQALRADGLTEVWQFLWDRALDMACAKLYGDGRQSLLIAVPFLPPWTGECLAADRTALTQVLKKQGVIPQRGKVHWFPTPQSIYALRDTSPLQLWMLNTAGVNNPYLWGYGQATTPTVYLLVGRLEFSERSEPIWPDPRLLSQAQAEALGWPPDALDACAPLRWFLERDNDEAESVGDRLMEMVFSVVATVKNWTKESEVRAEDCQIIVEERVNGMLHVFIQPNGRGKHLLCGLDYEAAQVPRDQILDQLRSLLEQLDFTLVTDGPRDGALATLH